MKNKHRYGYVLVFMYAWMMPGSVRSAEQPTALASRTVLLTGAAGFIGSNFLEYMFHKYSNYKFIVLDLLTYAGSLDNIPDEIKSSGRFTFCYGSVTNYRLVDSLISQADFVVHFAAETHVTRSIEDAAVFFDTDVVGTRVMLDALLKHKNVERFIHISTSEVYGTAEVIPMTEDHPLNPRTPYAAAKAAADRLVYAYQCTYDVPTVIVRPFNNYGPRQHVEKVIPRFITSVLRGQTIDVHGDGLQTRDWLHVTDTCRALDIILHHPHFSTIKNQVFHIGSEQATPIINIAKIIVAMAGLSEGVITFMPDRPGQVIHHIASNEKARTFLGWAPTVPLEEGLQSVMAWYTHNKEWWQKRILLQHVPIALGDSKIVM